MSQTKAFSIVLVLLLSLFTSSSNAKEMRALIVGVSDYPNLPKDFWLDGPRNDAVRVRNVLTQRGFAPQQITVLADGVSNAALPTRGNILAELDRMAKTADKDDLVFLYFADHGSQLPCTAKVSVGSATIAIDATELATSFRDKFEAHYMRVFAR